MDRRTLLIWRTKMKVDPNIPFRLITIEIDRGPPGGLDSLEDGVGDLVPAFLSQDVLTLPIWIPFLVKTHLTNIELRWIVSVFMIIQVSQTERSADEMGAILVQELLPAISCIKESRLFSLDYTLDVSNIRDTKFAGLLTYLLSQLRPKLILL